MEQSKHSEEEIIKLGEKIVQELDLEYSVNTLARWMSHYIAELIQDIEDADSESEKKVLKKECCDLILHIWSQKNILPIRKPLDDLKPLVEILEVLYEKKKIEAALISNNFDYFKEIINNYEKEYLYQESMSHNLWLVRLILANDKYEWKYLVEARKKFIKENHIINFKNKVKINNKVYDLNIILQALIKNKNNFSNEDKEWLLDKYKREIKLIKFYLEEELTSEITDKSIS